MELNRLAFIVSVAIFLTKFVALLQNPFLVNLNRIFTDNLELTVNDLTLLHAVVADDINGIVIHLMINARAIAGGNHHKLITLFKAV